MEHAVEPVGIDNRSVGIVDAAHGSPVVRRTAAVDIGFVHNRHILPGVEHIGFVCHCLPAIVTVKSYLCFTFFTAFGCNKNNAVCCLCAINGCGGCVFQYVYALDVGRIHIGDVAFDAVDKIKRTRIANCAETSDIHLHSRPRCTGFRRNVYARHLALHGLQRACGVHFGDFLTFYL